MSFILIVWLGIWAARQRILEEPERHVRLLRRSAVGGLGIAIAGALPIALVSAGVLHVDKSTASLTFVLGEQTGIFGGPGYVAVFGLIAMHLQRRKLGPFAEALRALGQRSLSGYLFQSVAWLILLAPYTLALGTKFGSPYADRGCGGHGGVGSVGSGRAGAGRPRPARSGREGLAQAHIPSSMKMETRVLKTDAD
jgi:uncharacterized protein